MMNACLTCQYRGSVPNSRHSSCQHPKVNDILGDHELLLRYMDGIINRHLIPNFYEDLKVEFAKEAIMEGWASFPFNFDPIWLRQCTGYQEVEK